MNTAPGFMLKGMHLSGMFLSYMPYIHITLGMS